MTFEDLNGKVQTLIHSKQFDVAIQTIDGELTKEQNDYRYYDLKHRVFWSKRDFNGAIHSLNKAIEINPHAFWLIARLGRFYWQKKDYVTAKKHYDRVIELRPEHHGAMHKLAKIYRAENKIQLSDELYKKSIQVQLKKDVVNRTTIIQNLINTRNYKNYLEIGVQSGVNFFQISADYKVAVDPCFTMEGEKRSVNSSDHFYELTSDDFFNSDNPVTSGEKLLDIAFIDGMHTFEQSREDVLNTLKYLKDDGIIIMHDCYPQNEAAAHPDMDTAIRMASFVGAWNGDVYKTIIWFRSNRSDLDVYTLDTDNGLGIITKKALSNTPLDYSEDRIKSMTYKDFIDLDPVKLLGLKEATTISCIA